MISNSDATTVINGALSGLTTGRTWKEKIILKGNFSINNTILIPSYVSINIQGRIKPSTNVDVFNNKDTTNTFIEIVGGELDGNSTNLTTAKGISLSGVTNLIIDDAYIHDTRRNAINLDNCDNIRISNNMIKDPGDATMGHGIFLDNGCSNVRIQGNDISGTSFTGIVLDRITTQATVIGNIITNAGWHGILTFSENNIVNRDLDITIVGNIINNPTHNGIYLDQHIKYGTVSGNIVRTAGTHGIQVDISAESLSITGNSIYNSGVIGLYAAVGLSKNNIIANNLIDTVGSGWHGIFVDAFDYGDLKNVLINGNIIINIPINPSGSAAIYITDDGGIYKWSDVSIVNNFIDTADYGIRLNTTIGTSSGALITNNYILRTTTPYSKNIGIANVTVKNNYGYTTDNDYKLEHIDDYIDDINALYERQTFNIRLPIWEAGSFTMLRGGKHPRIKIIDGWVTTADNSGLEQQIELEGISNLVDISGTYKAGVVIPMNIIRENLSFGEDITGFAQTNRHVIVELLCESDE